MLYTLNVNNRLSDKGFTEHTAEIISVLEAALQKWPAHPAVCHLYIHTMEASPTPEKALPAAKIVEKQEKAKNDPTGQASSFKKVWSHFLRIISVNILHVLFVLK